MSNTVRLAFGKTSAFVAVAAIAFGLIVAGGATATAANPHSSATDSIVCKDVTGTVQFLAQAHSYWLHVGLDPQHDSRHGERLHCHRCHPYQGDEGNSLKHTDRCCRLVSPPRWDLRLASYQRSRCRQVHDDVDRHPLVFQLRYSMSGAPCNSPHFEDSRFDSERGFLGVVPRNRSRSSGQGVREDGLDPWGIRGGLR